MINVIKKNIIFILPAILIIYFSLNLLGGNRGLFAYLDKKDRFENLLKKKLFLTNEITKVKKKLIGFIELKFSSSSYTFFNSKAQIHF